MEGGRERRKRQVEIRKKDILPDERHETRERNEKDFFLIICTTNKTY